jgi:hypothetical protein
VDESDWDVEILQSVHEKSKRKPKRVTRKTKKIKQGAQEPQEQQKQPETGATTKDGIAKKQVKEAGQIMQQGIIFVLTLILVLTSHKLSKL